jgi:hypothetical protein
MTYFTNVCIPLMHLHDEFHYIKQLDYLLLIKACKSRYDKNHGMPLN